jgi:hypothetical protein
MNWLYFSLVYFIQVAATWGRFQATCQPADGRPLALYFAHHALDVFLFWSPVFLRTRADYAAHTLLVLIVGAHWFYNNNRCIFTVEMNRRCGYPEGAWLDSLKNKFGLRERSEWFHFIWLGVLLAWDVWMLDIVV